MDTINHAIMLIEYFVPEPYEKLKSLRVEGQDWYGPEFNLFVVRMFNNDSEINKLVMRIIVSCANGHSKPIRAKNTDS